MATPVTTAKSPLARIKQLARQRDVERRSAPEELVDAIRAARSASPAYTLQEIADALGISRQAVQQLLKRHSQ